MISGTHRVEIQSQIEALSAQIAPDDYLSSVAERVPTHRFLGKCTQAVYRRQIAFLTQMLRVYTGQNADQLKILDWGCGKGHITYLLRQQGFNVVSTDLLADASDSAFGQQTPILEEMGTKVVPITDPVKLPFADASFDCVTSFGVLEHVGSDIDSLNEIRRVLKKNGIFYVTFLPYFLSWTQALARLRGNDYHDRLYNRRKVLALAKRAGFEVEALWLAQLFPKNSIPYRWDSLLEPVDRALCRYTPLKFFATNLEAVLRAA
jgi:SAM-dependent methyltransferase